MSKYVNNIVNYLFYVDMIMSFIFAYETADGQIETRLRKIALNYLKTWFFVDFCANFPFDLIMSLFNPK